GMPFSPHAVMANEYIRDMGIVVVSFGQYPDKFLYLLKEDRVVIVRLKIAVHFVMLGTGVENPPGGSRLHPVLGRRDAEGQLSAMVYPPLGGRVEYFPDKITLIRLKERPGEAEEHRVHAREITDCVRRGQLRAVILVQVGIEV